MSPIAVIIPTYRRPESLERALRSVLAQDDLAALAAEIAVVDNDPEGSARGVVSRLQQDGAPVLYVHAREPGVSNARNAGLAATTSPLIAFIDDDEAAPPHWLGALHRAHLALGADVTFGPVRGRADAAPAWKRGFLETFFSREGPSETALTDQRFGCGNAMLTRRTTLRGPAPFDPAANHTGGEDDRLFAALSREGRRFGWAAEAWLWEFAPAARLTARYALARAFGFGQSPSQISARAGDWGCVAQWMAIGAAQAGLFGAAALVLAPFDRARALPLAERAVKGLGKVVWFKSLHFYGRSTASAPTVRSPDASLNAMAAKITQ